MPEAPEVRLFFDLVKKYVGKTFNDFYVLKTSKGTFPDFVKAFPMTLTQISQIGKKLMIVFDDTWYFIVSLGLTGHFLTRRELNDDFIRNQEKYIYFSFDNQFYFSDVMGYSHVLVTNQADKVDAQIKSVGPNVMFDPVDSKYLLKIMKKAKDKDVSTFLTEQKYLSGIGQIYLSSTLYEEKICPIAKVDFFSVDAMEKVLETARKIMNESYERMKRGGDLVEPVYQRDTDTFGNNVKKYKMKNGRSVWYAPDVQRRGCD